MSSPRSQRAWDGPTTSSAVRDESGAAPIVLLQLDASGTETDRAVLRGLLRCGVSGSAAMATLVLVRALIGVLREDDARTPLGLRLDTGSRTIRLDLASARGPMLLPRLARVMTDSCAELPDHALRWGTVHDGTSTEVWIEIDPTEHVGGTELLDGASQVDAGLAAVEPVELLLDLNARLSFADSMRAVCDIVSNTLRSRLGASSAGLALRYGSTIRFVTRNSDRGLRIPLNADFPVAASIRDGTSHFLPDAALADAQFPGAGTELRMHGNHAMASVPLIMAARPIGALVVTWARPQPVEHFDHLEALFTIVASHLAQATNRVTSSAVVAGAPRLGDAAASFSLAASGTEVGPLRLDLVSRSVCVPGRPDRVRLTGREFELLVHLRQHAGRPQNRNDLLRAVWGIDFRAGTSVVDVTVSRLRRKLGSDLIVTVRDRGYMLRAS